MKKLKSLLVILLSVILLTSCSMFFNVVNANIVDKNGNEIPAEDTDYYGLLYGKTSNVYEFNSTEFLEIYSINSTSSEKTAFKKDRVDENDQSLIPIYYFNNEDVAQNTVWRDNNIYSNDASIIISLAAINESDHSYQMDIIKSLAKELNIDSNDITLYVKVKTPVVPNYYETSKSYEINSKNGVTAEIRQLAGEFKTVNLRSFNTDDEKYSQQIITATAKTSTGAEYDMVLGRDDNFYLTRKMGPPTPSGDEEKVFETDLSYKSISNKKEVEGKLKEGVYYPPYYENEDKNAKKDADAYGIITSTKNVDIVKTNDVELKADGSANSEGWYYPDVTNKKVIEKEYKFDTYNNPKDNGAVKETVKLTGANDLTDTETPNIRWTLRRINYEEKTNDDKSVTVIITYNLPIDKGSIPDGWEAIADKDGGIRKIKRTFKQGEDYDKNVTVKQNGDPTVEVTTPVKVKWDTANKTIPQTGAFTLVITLIVAGSAVFAYTRYRKLNK